MGELKRFFCLLLVFWSTCFCLCSVHAQEMGATAWEQLPFGQIRLMSCREGVKQTHPMVGGLEINLNDEWYLKKPHLSSLDSKTPLWIEYPIRPAPQETKIYMEKLFIPLVASAFSKGGVFGVQGELTACHHPSDCLTLPIQFQLPLSDTTDAYTGYCAYITEQLNQVPLPLPKGVSASFNKISDTEAELTFTGLKGIQQAFLQNDSGVLFEMTEREFLPDGVRFKIHTVPNSSKQNWILITNQGVFRVKNFTAGLLSQKQHLPWMTFIFGGLLLFVCSPLFFWWGLNWPKKKGLSVVQSTQMAEQATYMIVAWVILSALGYNEIQTLFTQRWFLRMIFGLLIVMLFVPAKNPWLVGFLFLLWPKAYLNDLLGVLNENKTLWVAGALNFVLWGWLAFYLRSKYADVLEKKMRQAFKKSFFKINLFFLLPTLMMAIYIGRLLWMPLPEFSYNIKEGLTVVCVPYTLECASWQDEKIPVTFIDATSKTGQHLLNTYHRVQGPLVVLSTPTEKTIFPEGASFKEVKNFLIDWRNYHVLGRQAYPLTHFGDDLRVPSPSAK